MKETTVWVQPLVPSEMKSRALLREHGLIQSLYCFLYYSFAAYLPSSGMPGTRLGNWLRRVLARRILRRCGYGLRISAHVSFSSGTELEVGNNCKLGRGTWILGPVVIGNDFIGAPDVTILAYNHAHDIGEPIICQGSPILEPVVIGDDVWICTRAIILPGVRVGNHAIIGAGAVVTKNVDDWAIVAGNPAKFIRDRRVPKEQDENHR